MQRSTMAAELSTAMIWQPSCLIWRRIERVAAPSEQPKS
ncbi:Uncharacterised protein [Vibrio cholerae]|nr:Uncharacterised protein [Vibrio cholerae]